MDDQNVIAALRQIGVSQEIIDRLVGWSEWNRESLSETLRDALRIGLYEMGEER